MMGYIPKVNDVVQLDPHCTANPMFGGCMLIVTDVAPWGVQGYVQGLGEGGEIGGMAGYRAQTGTFEYVGKSVWSMHVTCETVTK